MKAARAFPRVTVTEKAEESIRKGHPWIYDTEIPDANDEIGNGELVDAVSVKGAYLGTGFLSKSSKIRIRLLGNNPNEKYDAAFFRRRIKYAVDYRRTVMKDDFPCCRLVFGEADGLPGLTVDRYESILSVQSASYGMEQRKGEIYEALFDVMKEYGVTVSIYERNDLSVRKLERLPEYKSWYEPIPHPETPFTEITENGIVYGVDIENGQKTGFFLDQKYNRAAVGRIAEGKRVLDCFTHTGSFALNAKKGGAEKVTAVDISDTALSQAKANADRNGLEIDFVRADVFELLTDMAERRERGYDFIILDPPAFTKSSRTVLDAERGYREINYLAMKILPRGGYLATCSCSHFMESKMFLKAIKNAADDAGVTLKLAEARRQSPDHPVLLGVPETDYLKFYVFQVV